MSLVSSWIFGCAVFLYAAAMIVSIWALARRSSRAVPWIPRITAVGLVFHFAGLVRAALERSAILALSLREILFLLAFAAISVYLLAHFKFRLEVMGVIILPLIVALMGVTLLVPDEGSEAAQAWQVSLRAVHVIPAVLGAAFLFVTFTTSVIYLIQERGLKEHKPLRFFISLPSLERCDRLNYLSLGWGFSFLTLVVVSGALTNKYTHGDSSWVLREWYSLMAWLLFAVVIYDRVFAGRWRGRLSSYLSIIGFVAIILRMVGIGT